MARGLDHVVHAVRDLDAAAEFYRRLGFIVGARNRHPWGTHNRIVQMPRFFVELLTVAEPENIPPSGGRFFSFGAFNRAFLARQEGLSMIALESRDAGSDLAAFRTGGISDFDLFHFERMGTGPDGAAATLAFSLAFARDPMAPEAGFFTCQHHHPENFWNAAVQRHPNAVIGVGGVDLVADNPSDHHIFLSALTGERELLATSAGISVATPRGDIRFMDPTAFAVHYGVDAPDVSRGARFAALRFLVEDLSPVTAVFKKNGIEAQSRMGRLVVGPEIAHGATLVFETAA
jgi:catechol 2,3-dioxygenase-like lactoylglutathione lyase family enzyme